jgi:hypothetical protein
MSSKNIFGLLANLDVNDMDAVLSSPEEEPVSEEEETQHLEEETESSEDKTHYREDEPQPPQDDDQHQEDKTHYHEDNNQHPEDDPQSAADALEERIVLTTFDLATFETSHLGPVFTRALLHEIAFQIALISNEYSTPPLQRAPISQEYVGADEKAVVIWKPVLNAHANKNTVCVQYMTRVELLPSFAERFGNDWCRHIEQRRLNPLISAIAPYYLLNCALAPCLPMPQPLLQRLLQTKKLWLASQSCAQLDHIVKKALDRLTFPITQIVGIGLGHFSFISTWYAGSALQHIAAIHFARAITHYNVSHFPRTRPVKIVLSDPCYDHADADILKQLGSRIDVQMKLSDPDVLLAVNRGSMVMNAYLPWKSPLMQILADLFCLPSTSSSSSSYNSPGILFTDKIEPASLSPTMRMYAMHNRSAPHVARWLEGYEMWKGGFVGAGKEVDKDVGGARYWVKDMKIWVRK